MGSLMRSGKEVTTVKSKVTLIKDHRTAKLGAIKIIAAFKEPHSSNNIMQSTEHSAALGVAKPWRGSQRTVWME